MIDKRKKKYFVYILLLVLIVSTLIIIADTGRIEQSAIIVALAFDKEEDNFILTAKMLTPPEERGKQ